MRDDDAVDLEALLRDLADDDVRVVAVGGGDDGIGVLDARLAQQVGVHAVADDEAAAPVLAEPRERVLVLVDDGHVPALLWRWSAIVEPTRPQPMTSAFIAGRQRSSG